MNEDAGPYTLRVPLDTRGEQLARLLVARDEVDAVRSGLELLAEFKSPENRTLTRAMLLDRRSFTNAVTPSDAWPGRIDYLATRYYPARAAAVEVLRRRWGEAAPEVVLVESALPYAPVPSAWWLAGIAVAAAVGAIVRRRYRAFDPFRASFGRRVFTGAMVVSFLLGVVTAILWVQSFWFADNLVVPTANAEHEISSVRGAVRYLVLHDRPTMERAVVGRQRLTQPLADWQAGSLVPGRSVGRFGFGADEGKVTRYAYRRYRVPTWCVTTVFLLPPVVWLTAGAWRRRRARARGGLCPGCGYDVRATPVRCPECGQDLRVMPLTRVG